MINQSKHPRVFLSHASEDKDRFVLNFAKRLRERGVDVWLDKWEMLPGDSLVDKIFEEGLKEAEAVLVVISSNSSSKSWVREEINSAFVSHVSKGTKILPIILDSCEVPAALQATVWEKIIDLNNCEENINRVVSAIFNSRIKPELGNPPDFSGLPIKNIPDLTTIDNLVLKISCDYLIANERLSIAPEVLFLPGNAFDLSRQDVLDAIEVLESRGYLEVSRCMGGDQESWGLDYHVSHFGLEKYVRAYLSSYPQFFERVISLIVNNEMTSNLEIRDATGESRVLIDHILDELEMDGHVKLSKSNVEYYTSIFHVSATLKRL